LGHSFFIDNDVFWQGNDLWAHETTSDPTVSAFFFLLMWKTKEIVMLRYVT
jgi:hypothetical protein